MLARRGQYVNGMRSGYGGMIDLHFVSIAGWSATAVLEGDNLRINEKARRVFRSRVEGMLLS